MKTISETYAPGQQSHDYESIMTEAGRTLRVRIRRDAYPFQSYALIEVWDGDRWQEVHSLHYSLIQMRKSYCAPATAQDFRPDRAELLRVARAVLTPHPQEA